MSVKQRSGMIPTLLVLVVVLTLGYIIVLRPVQTNGHHKQRVILSVTFLPEVMPRSQEAVDITISINGAPTETHQWRRSPFVAYLDLPKGQTVSIEAEREVIMLLECFIHVDAKQVDHQSVNGGGRVKCNYKVTFGEGK